MTRILLTALTALSYLAVSAQDITGQWNGILKIPGTPLRLVFNVTQTGSGYSSTLDSPDQGAKGIPVSNTTFEDSLLIFEVSNLNIVYKGTWKGDDIEGTFKQGEQTFPLNLSRKPVEKPVVKRPQEPVKPYPYHAEDIAFRNADANITLAGTLTLPNKDGNFPGVVLITGSGTQNRDEELFGHKPFLVIADYLTRNGIAVLRYDDRGFGQSQGDFSKATSSDFAKDVESAVAYLKTRKEIDPVKIGLIGHSEGGIVAPMVASISKDISFIILLAGTGIRGDSLLLLQQEAIAKASGMPEQRIQETKDINRKAFDMVLQSANTETLKANLTGYIKQVLQHNPAEIPNGMTEDAFAALQVNQLTSPWMQYFIKYDPATALQKVTCPVLALNGEKDLQVPAKENLHAIETALKKGGNRKATIVPLPGLNHLFQDCTTGLPNEYATIEETFSPVALDRITRWIKEQIE